MRNIKKLSDDEISELDGFLARIEDGDIKNTESLDGFFAAVVCCPDFILPSEYMPIIQSGESENGDLVFENLEEAKIFTELVTRHYNHVNYQLGTEGLFLPLLLENEVGAYLANDWANGFIAGTYLRMDIWSTLTNDEEHGGSIVPIWALAYEHDPDPNMRPFNEPITEKKREELILGAAAGVLRMYHYFLDQRDAFTPKLNMTSRHTTKVASNAPCPCGSGKKYKRCCAEWVKEPTIH